MKRFMPAIFICAIFIVVTGCAPKMPTLDGSLRPEDPAHKGKIVMTLNDPLADDIGAELSSRGFTVIGPARLRQVLNERSLQLSGLKSTDDEKLLEAGKALNADSLILVESERQPDGTTDAASITIVGVQSGLSIGSFNYQNGRNRENQKDTAKRIADAISKSFK